MQKIRLRRISIKSIIVTIVGCILIIFGFSLERIIKRLDKPFSLMQIRAGHLLVLVILILYSCKGILETYTLAAKLIETHELKISELLWLMPLWFIIAVTIYYWKYPWYYIRHDKGTILSSWYVNKSLELNKEQEVEKSYEYLQKASQLKPDSVMAWCILADFNQLFLKDPTQADQYLLKAREVLNSNSSNNPKQTAIVECYYGFIMQYRDDYQAALEHMKKAYELDPTKYRKGQYEKALQMVKDQKGDDAEL